LNSTVAVTLFPSPRETKRSRYPTGTPSNKFATGKMIRSTGLHRPGDVKGGTGLSV